MYGLSGFNLPFKVDTLMLFTTVSPFSMLQMATNKRLSTEVYLGLVQGGHKDVLTAEIIKYDGFFYWMHFWKYTEFS